MAYKVVVVGMGKRGGHHAAHFHANPNFEVAGICDIDEGRLQKAAAGLGNPEISTNAAALAGSIKPDVFCFCTLPNLRAEMVQLGIESGAKLIAFEKPIALSSAEGLKVKAMLDAAGVKAVVSHQHRYGPHYQAVKELIASGALGRLNTVYASAVGWAAHMMSHMIDYATWYNGYERAEWVIAQAAGQEKLADIHASPDYVAGFIHYANGVHGSIEVGCGAPDVPEVGKWFHKNRIGAQGTEGFAEVLTGGGWRAVTKSRGYEEGPGKMDYDQDMPQYIQEMAEWLDGGSAHPCAFANAFAGFEIMAGLYRSVLEGGQVKLPLTSGMDEIAELRKKVVKDHILSFPESTCEYHA